MISILMPACATDCWIDSAIPVTGCVLHVDRHREAVLQACLGEQFLGLGSVELVGVLIERAELAGRQEGLVDRADALDQRRADRIVVDRVLEASGLPASSGSRSWS